MHSTTPPETQHAALNLLLRSHAPDIANEIFLSHIVRRPLLLRPSSPPATPSTHPDARTQRQRARERKEKEKEKRRRKPRPLSAKEKRKLGVHDVQSGEVRYEVFRGLSGIWAGYIRDVLGLGGPGGGYVVKDTAGPLLASADFHGAEVEVVRCRCVTRVGLRGFVVKETRGAFVVVGTGDRVWTIPKAHTVFRFEVPFVGDQEGEEEGKEGDGVEAEMTKPKSLVFELHGDQFEIRPAERANKKFKFHIPPDI
ncbi:RNase P/MRP, p29 subunit [Patellaria atrata CBS 101060]|uniref:RNase P/MRP, p29 subunit n=1 Tax=Patellaria atrata CBS 101060 TaxID=1346257 RepID=A0A9P4S9W1_9PEZI|nr:RNase P/MRP, p29 subunit [Patellaria atrata CBS 101060]